MSVSIVALLVALSAQARPEEGRDRSETNAQSEAGQRQQAEIEDLQEDDVTQVETDAVEPTDELRDDVVEFYGSARIAAGFEGDEPRLRDNLSRAGLYAAKDFAPGYGLFARLEVGVNLVNTFDRILNPKTSGPEGSGNVVPRLGYLGIDSPYGQLSFGKEWSPYRAVAVFTDRFAFSGGLASASFNAGTDGSATGTGRSQSALNYHMKKSGGVDFRFQWQPGSRSIPNASESDYDYGLGASVTYEWDSKITFGAAYNVARISEVTEELEKLGITGDAEALLLGVMYRDEPVYVAVNYVQHKNHDTDDRFIYIDARGFELYSRYTIGKRYRAVAGLNLLNPRKRPEGSRYNMRIGFFDFQYSLRDGTFRDIVFAQFILDDSLRSDGTRYDNAIVFGFRWSIDI